MYIKPLFPLMCDKLQSEVFAELDCAHHQTNEHGSAALDVLRRKSGSSCDQNRDCRLLQCVRKPSGAGHQPTEPARVSENTTRAKRGDVFGTAADQIRIGDIFRDIEGALPIAECFADADNSCPFVSSCRLRVALQDAAVAFYRSLDGITLDALVCDNTDLLKLLRPVTCDR